MKQIIIFSTLIAIMLSMAIIEAYAEYETTDIISIEDMQKILENPNNGKTVSISHIWDKSELTYDIDVKDREFKTIIQDAINQWNLELNDIDMKLIKTNGNADITISLDDLHKTSLGESATTINKDTIYNNIVFNNDIDTETLYKTALHEIGHTLGIEHTDYKGLMSAVLQDQTDIKITDCMIDALANQQIGVYQC